MKRPTSPRPSICRTADFVVSSKERPLIKVTSSSTPNRARFLFRSLKIFLLAIRKCFNCPPASMLTIFFFVHRTRAHQMWRRLLSHQYRGQSREYSRAEPGEVIDKQQDIHM